MKSAEQYFSDLETYNQVNEPPMVCLSPIALKSTIRLIQSDALLSAALLFTDEEREIRDRILNAIQQIK